MMKVKCTWCEEEFYEDKIVLGEEGEEHCPFCGKEGRLMDLGDDEEEDGEPEPEPYDPDAPPGWYTQDEDHDWQQWLDHEEEIIKEVDKGEKS